MLLDQYRLKSKLYRSNVVLAPLGDDFRWDSQREIDYQFINYFKLMDYINSHPELHASVQFGTLSDYFEALRASSPPDGRNSLVPGGLPMLTGDFFTYADRYVCVCVCVCGGGGVCGMCVWGVWGCGVCGCGCVHSTLHAWVRGRRDIKHIA